MESGSSTIHLSVPVRPVITHCDVLQLWFNALCVVKGNFKRFSKPWFHSFYSYLRPLMDELPYSRWELRLILSNEIFLASPDCFDPSSLVCVTRLFELPKYFKALYSILGAFLVFFEQANSYCLQKINWLTNPRYGLESSRSSRSGGESQISF